MQLKTILNRVQRHKYFVYENVSWSEDQRSLEARVRPRRNSKLVCSGCERPAPQYDRQPERRFEFVPLWGIALYFLYAMRRVNCPACGVKVERVPWARGKCRLTVTYQWFLARWAKRLSWSEVAKVFQTSWESVFRSVTTVVGWGLQKQSLDGIKAIGVDEIQWRRGHKYLTLVYQIERGARRLLWIGLGRDEESLESFFRRLGQERSRGIQFVCSDMWRPYLKVISSWATNAIHVLDRYHIMALMNRAIDKIRSSEAKALVRDGYEPILKRSRWCLLKRKENLTDKQTVKLKELLKYNLRSVRAYLLREDFQRLWDYVSPFWARRFLREWCTRPKTSEWGEGAAPGKAPSHFEAPLR